MIFTSDMKKRTIAMAANICRLLAATERPVVSLDMDGHSDRALTTNSQTVHCRCHSNISGKGMMVVIVAYTSFKMLNYPSFPCATCFLIQKRCFRILFFVRRRNIINHSIGLISSICSSQHTRKLIPITFCRQRQR